MDKIRINIMNSKVFGQSKPVIGVLQLLPLPGSTRWDGRIDRVIARAEQEATALATGGVDGILVENTFDAPYSTGRMDPAGAIAMGLIIRRMMHFTHLPFGVNVLRNDPETALAIAMNVGARFIRTSLLTGSAISESGLLQGKSHELAAYRRLLHVEGISVFADISLERIAPLITNEIKIPVTLKSLARQAMESGGADGLILTDNSLSPEAIQELTRSMDVPVFYEYSHSLALAGTYLEAAGGLVVSSAIKKSSTTTSDLTPTVDLTKVEELMAFAEIARSRQASVNPSSILAADTSH